MESRARSSTTPAAFLKSIAQHIIDVHSQHQNLLLGNDSYQMMIVDTVADNGNERASYSEAYERYRALRHQIEKMTHDNEKLKSDADYIAFQHQQLAEAKLKDGELAELEALKARYGLDIDKRKISVDGIKNVGPAEAVIKLYPEVSAKLKLNIVAKA